MSPVEVQKVYLRFSLGRDTAEDRQRYRFGEGWSVGAFVDGNAIEVLS